MGSFGGRGWGWGATFLAMADPSDGNRKCVSRTHRVSSEGALERVEKVPPPKGTGVHAPVRGGQPVPSLPTPFPCQYLWTDQLTIRDAETHWKGGSLGWGGVGRREPVTSLDQSVRGTFFSAWGGWGGAPWFSLQCQEVSGGKGVRCYRAEKKVFRCPESASESWWVPGPVTVGEAGVGGPRILTP